MDRGVRRPVENDGVLILERIDCPCADHQVGRNDERVHRRAALEMLVAGEALEREGPAGGVGSWWTGVGNDDARPAGWRIALEVVCGERARRNALEEEDV